MRINLVFTYHAAQRWFERCSNLDFRSETKTIRRDKKIEKEAMRCGNGYRKIYRTKSGVALVVKGDLVITVFLP